MSRTSRNFVIAYALLVGLPLLGLAGVLRAGRKLPAPISINGSWKLEADASQLPPQSCGVAISSLGNSVLDISQSGTSVAISSEGSANASGWGAITGQNLQGALIPTASPASDCGKQIRLTATVNAQTQPRSLAGVISVDGCPSCAELNFHAVRLPRARGGGAH